MALQDCGPTFILIDSVALQRVRCVYVLQMSDIFTDTPFTVSLDAQCSIDDTGWLYIAVGAFSSPTSIYTCQPDLVHAHRCT